MFKRSLPSRIEAAGLTTGAKNTPSHQKQEKQKRFPRWARLALSAAACMCTSPLLTGATPSPSNTHVLSVQSETRIADAIKVHNSKNDGNMNEQIIRAWLKDNGAPQEIIDTVVSAQTINIQNMKPLSDPQSITPDQKNVLRGVYESVVNSVPGNKEVKLNAFDGSFKPVSLNATQKEKSTSSSQAELAVSTGGNSDTHSREGNNAQNKADDARGDRTASEHANDTFITADVADAPAQIIHPIIKNTWQFIDDYPIIGVVTIAGFIIFLARSVFTFAHDFVKENPEHSFDDADEPTGQTSTDHNIDDAMSESETDGTQKRERRFNLLGRLKNIFPLGRVGKEPNLSVVENLNLAPVSTVETATEPVSVEEVPIEEEIVEGISRHGTDGSGIDNLELPTPIIIEATATVPDAADLTTSHQAISNPDSHPSTNDGEGDELVETPATAEHGQPQDVPYTADTVLVTHEEAAEIEVAFDCDATTEELCIFSYRTWEEVKNASSLKGAPLDNLFIQLKDNTPEIFNDYPLFVDSLNADTTIPADVRTWFAQFTSIHQCKEELRKLLTSLQNLNQASAGARQYYKYKCNLLSDYLAVLHMYIPADK